MTILELARRLYSLDTLDARFTNSSKRHGEIGSRTATGVTAAEDERASRVSPSLWGTLEFYVYYLVIGVAMPVMFKVAFDVSSPSHSNYSKFEHLLSPGWIAGRKVDNSDSQYAGFRDNIPYMLILLISHPLLRRIYESIHGRSHGSLKINKSDNEVDSVHDIQADARSNQRLTFDLYFAALFVVALHGFSALKVLSILYVNYALAKRLPRAYVPAATWIFNIGILLANELYRGYPFAPITDFLLPSSASTRGPSERNQANWGSILDSYGGLVPRWEVLFNFTLLRLISFNFDFYWSNNRIGDSSLEVCLFREDTIFHEFGADFDKKKQLDPANLSERDRVAIPANAQDYNFRNYLAYVLYAPLYLTGPILTFNDYISQTRYVPKSITMSRTLLYGLRFFISLLVMEFMIHFIYAVAISKSQPDWEIYTPFQLSMLGYFNLHHIWLKLLLPWRFFRFWALLDSIDPPENMVRCMSNNYSTFAFWRSWHRSFNRWILRYIYVPLGGSGGPETRGPWGKVRAVGNLLPVFTFVALWHDIDLKLLVWGWLVTFLVVPEAIAEFLFPKRKWENHKYVYRMICGVGAVGNILMLMAVNLVGFAVGLDGIKGLLQGIIGSYSGLGFLLLACVALFTASQVMFEIREDELKQGIRMKC